MFGDPDEFDVATLREFGMWPKPDLISQSMIPYVKRMKKEVVVSIFNDTKGENTIDLLENCPDIRYINVYNDVENLVFEKNTKGFEEKIKRGKFTPQKKSDVVAINFPFTQSLSDLYSSLRSGGLFAGSDHDNPEMKELLKTFRMSDRVSIPISVANRVTWFWRKP